jgi:methyl-accepting chemotaxis protein
MKLGPKLLAAPLATAVVVLAVGQLNGMMLLHGAAESRQSFQDSVGDFKTVAGVKEQLAATHAGVYRTVALIGSLDDAKIKASRAELKSRTEGAKRSFAALASTDADPALQAVLAQAGPQIDRYLKQADEAIDLSSVDPNTGIAAMQGADKSFGELTATAAAVVGRIDELTASTVAAAEARSQRTSLLLGALGLLVASAAVGVSWWMQRRLVADLKRAAEVAGQVAQGRLDAVPATQRADEVGDVLRALAHMTGELSRSMRTVQESSSSIHTASVEIASGNADLSGRTEQAASSLQQTASSMEQLTDTVGQSADAARQASQLAHSAAAVAQRGGVVVAQVVTTMGEINTSSRKIGDIIGTIDGIAFQTNILALNAAVEAARAGEQGRGFAVVASEVRSLAQRSAEAAREIKALIGASVDKVESGSKLVADAGSTMGEIVASVQRVSDIIAEISAAATEQRDGIGQVNGAVNSLDHMTQQNAALVEQSTAAAESLKEQAARLGEVVGRFTLAR